mgnify:CR=1 FL=1
MSESGNLHFQVRLAAELEGMCPVSYADPLLLIERCIVIYTGLVVFQGSLQGETAVPPASCLERENGRERKVLSVIPVLPVVDGFQTVGV